MSTLRVEILHTQGCGGTPHAIAAARSAVADLSISAEVSAVLVETEKAALLAGFRGSPTVTVDGVDIEEDPSSPVGSFG